MQEKSTLKNQKTLLIINTGSLKKRFILQRIAKIPNLKKVVVNAQKNWAENYVDDWILVDTTNHDATIRAITEYAKKNQVDGVVTFWEDDVLLTAKLSEILKKPGISWKVASKARNKFAFREFCRKHNLPAPNYSLVKSDEELKEILKTLKLPVVFKPTFGSSSAFVIKAEDQEEAFEVYEFLKRNINTQVESALTDGLEVMIEEYIDGDEVDIDILLQNGKIKYWSITDNYKTEEPYFMESGMAIPSALPEEDQKELVDMAESVLEHLGITNGCIHFEAKQTSTGPVPIEVNLRMGGDEVYSFSKQAWKVDLIEYAVKIALGEYFPRIDKPEEPAVYLTGTSFIPENSGVISSLDIPEKFSAKDQVDEFEFYKEVGDTVFVPPAAYEFLGWITTKGENPNDSRENLEKVLEKINYEIIPFSEVSAVGKTKRANRFSVAKFDQRIMAGQARIEKIRRVKLSEQRKLHLAIACNTFSGADGAIEAELTSVGNKIRNTLETRGYKTSFIDFNDLKTASNMMQSQKIDLIFNVAERINGSSLLEPHVASFFDAYQIPYTGSNPFTLSLAIDKIKVKKLLTYHQIPTAKWDYAFTLQDEIRDDLVFPLIVKPATTDNSIGINQDSVVRNQQELKRQIKYVLEELRSPALIEEYLPGDEYDVSIIGNGDELRVLPLSRTQFNKMPKGMWNIYSFDSKFGNHSDFKNFITEERPPKGVSKKLISLITEMAMDTYSILDCHDYGRVEIKLDEQGNPHVLELNPNPSINEPDCLPSVAKLTGMNYGDFLEEIISLAIKRYQNSPPYYHLQPQLR